MGNHIVMYSNTQVMILIIIDYTNDNTIVIWFDGISLLLNLVMGW